MLTAWAKKIESATNGKNGGLYYPSITATSEAFIEAKTVSGNTKYIAPYVKSKSNSAIVSAFVESNTNASKGIAFGSDSTPPTENDYTLGSLITGISANVSNSTFFDSANNKYVLRMDCVVSNDTGSTITIREIALFSVFAAASTRGSTPSSAVSGQCSFMMDRTVLDTPVVIEQGSAGTIRYEFAF